MSETSLPSFFADDMVRRLARLLRTIGYDTRYETEKADSELARIALAEGRIILTRDTSFPTRFPDLPMLVFKEENPWLQFRQVVERFRLDPFAFLFTRCTLCNGKLLPVNKEDFREAIPPRTYAIVDRYFQCNGCGKLYWEGSHTEQIRKRLAELTPPSNTGILPGGCHSR
jgi:uncharacterized protein with PIN domain